MRYPRCKYSQASDLPDVLKAAPRSIDKTMRQRIFHLFHMHAAIGRYLSSSCLLIGALEHNLVDHAPGQVNNLKVRLCQAALEQAYMVLGLYQN